MQKRRRKLGMVDFVGDWCKQVEAVPPSHVIPLESRPLEAVPIAKEIPVVDLEQANKGKQQRLFLAQQLLNAWKEYGFFQVINHGVPENLMDEAMKVYEEVFSLPEEEKVNYARAAEKSEGKAMLYSNLAGYYGSRQYQFWRDALQLSANVGTDDKKYWPDNPPRLREVIGSYAAEVRRLSKKILELIGEAMGIEEGHFDKQVMQRMTVNHYPPCPDPSLTLGLGGHCDSNLLTITQQQVYGLQILKKDKWIGVEPHPHAFVVNVGMALTLISNGTLESVVHRVVTNTRQARTSICTFIHPGEGLVEPAQSLVGPDNPQIFRSVDWFAEFMPHYLTKQSDNNAALDVFKISA